MKDQPDGSKTSFFSTLPGILTGVAGLLTAVAAVAALFITSSDSSPPDTTTGSSVSPPAASPPPPAPAPAPPPSAVTPPPSGPGAGFRVVETLVRADPFEGSHPCPVEIALSGRISVAGGSGTVTYRWIRDDNASAPVQTLSFDGPGSMDVQTTWTRSGEPGATIEGWQAIEIIDPAPAESERATFALQCG